jgi:hypothetical protein
MLWRGKKARSAERKMLSDASFQSLRPGVLVVKTRLVDQTKSNLAAKKSN